MSFISIITPSYNDINLLKQEIPSLISYLKAKNYQFEFIVVDDGSNQKTACEEFCAQVGIKFLFNEVNLGKGAAVKKGMMAASGDVRIFTDCDIPFEYENIEQCISVIENEGADLAIGNRRMKDSQYYNKISFLRNVGSKLFTFFVGKFVTTGLFDTQCGLKAFRGEVANFLFSRSRINGFAFDVEILNMAMHQNYRIQHIPVKFRSSLGTSNVMLLKHGIKMIYDIFRMKYFRMKGFYN